MIHVVEWRVMDVFFLHSSCYLFFIFLIAGLGIDSDFEPVEGRWRARKDEQCGRNGARCGQPWDPL